MHMLYNSDSFAVVEFDVPADGPRIPHLQTGDASSPALSRGGYEIVDKFARKELFIEGALAEHFKLGVQALIDTSPSEEEVDAYIGRFSALMQQPVVLH